MLSHTGGGGGGGDGGRGQRVEAEAEGRGQRAVAEAGGREQRAEVEAKGRGQRRRKRAEGRGGGRDAHFLLPAVAHRRKMGLRQRSDFSPFVLYLFCGFLMVRSVKMGSEKK